jgi:hypothetical protein
MKIFLLLLRLPNATLLKRYGAVNLQQHERERKSLMKAKKGESVINVHE